MILCDVAIPFTPHAIFFLSFLLLSMYYLHTVLFAGFNIRTFFFFSYIVFIYSARPSLSVCISPRSPTLTDQELRISFPPSLPPSPFFSALLSPPLHLPHSHLPPTTAHCGPCRIYSVFRYILDTKTATVIIQHDSLVPWSTLLSLFFLCY